MDMRLLLSLTKHTFFFQDVFWTTEKRDGRMGLHAADKSRLLARALISEWVIPPEEHHIYHHSHSRLSEADNESANTGSSSVSDALSWVQSPACAPTGKVILVLSSQKVIKSREWAALLEQTTMCNDAPEEGRWQELSQRQAREK